MKMWKLARSLAAELFTPARCSQCAAIASWYRGSELTIKSELLCWRPILMSQERHHTPREVRAFTIIELVTVIATIAVLSALLLPGLAKSQTQTHVVIDTSNVRQILKAAHVYAGDNSDFLPHPTWGTAITGWAYSAGIRDGALSFGATQAQVAAVVSNQLGYFRKSQLAPLLNNDQKLLECPTDVAMRRTGDYKIRYLQRQIKLTSYCFSGAVSGFGTQKEALNANTGGTYKLSSFRPSSFILWEEDEMASFNFNDAGSNQENSNEGLSQRHTILGGTGRTTVASNSNGRGMVGTFGGEANFFKLKAFAALRVAPPENDVRCGPGYR
jgi:type II secretory pathway pseudopilin PulG